MLALQSWWWIGAAALAVPASFALAALAAPWLARGGARPAAVSGLALGLSTLVSAATALNGAAPVVAAGPPVRVDVVTCVMLVLVCSVSLVIGRYSSSYLRGEPGLARYFRWFFATLAAVTLLVVTRNLLVLALAWTATSLSLHQLLTFYADRPAARLAANKKFLVSRVADACLLGCLVLVHAQVSSFDLDDVARWAGAHPALTPSMQGAAVLMVAAVALKSAQLPFHGWLIQVMEAPTPVSALLHAGVVNVGGFVLIRLSPWMARAPLAQALLVAVGLLTAVLATLVMTTRVSVKVALAWSTCAQMGFMLVQCGLGAWHLALLHLVAHSLYKAHAFLNAGSAVAAWRVQAITPRAAAPSWARLGLTVAGSVAFAGFVTVLCLRVTGATEALELPSVVLAGLVGLSLAPLFLRRPVAGAAATLTSFARAATVAVLYLAGHAGAARLVPAAPASPIAWSVVGAGLALLFLVKVILGRRPGGAFARTLHAWLFAGLYLDEHLTRLTYRLLPPRPPAPRSSLIHAPEALEARP